MKPQCVTIQMKTIEQYFHVVLFIRLHKMALPFKFVCEAPQCDHANDDLFRTLSSIFFFRGEVVNGGFGLVLDGSQVSIVLVEQNSIDCRK